MHIGSDTRSNLDTAVLFSLGVTRINSALRDAKSMKRDTIFTASMKLQHVLDWSVLTLSYLSPYLWIVLDRVKC